MSIGWIIFWVVYVVSLVGDLYFHIKDKESEGGFIVLYFIPFLNAFLFFGECVLEYMDYREGNKSKNKTSQKSKQAIAEELQVSDDSLIEKILRADSIHSSNIIYSIINRLKSSSKSKYYCASLIGSVKSLFLDAVRDAYNITPYDMKLKPHVVASELQSTMDEISKALNIQIQWIKDMDAKELKLDSIDYSARESKRLDIIRSMTSDFIEMNNIENVDKVKDYTDPYGGIFKS